MCSFIRKIRGQRKFNNTDSEKIYRTLNINISCYSRTIIVIIIGIEPIMKLLIQFILASHLLSNPAYAYLDPGVGSVILQAVIGATAVAMTTVSLYWQKIKNFFGIDKKKKTEKKKE